MSEIIKIGRKKKHLAIPDGWELVKDGEAREGDKFANVASPRPFWQLTDDEDWGMASDLFDALIRQKTGTRSSIG